MSREYIEQAAENYASAINDKRLNSFPVDVRPQLSPEYESDDIADAFKAGAECRINSVWHTNTEMPKYEIDKYGCGKDCLVKPKHGVIEIGEVMFDNDAYFISCNRGTYKMDEVDCWAYVSDLMPDGKEE